jgi:hypothetical protein
MLAELKALHSEIEGQLEALDVLTARIEPPKIAELSNVRLALTRASRARFQLLHLQGYAAAMRHADPAQRATIERMRSDGIALIGRSASHIGCWTPIEVGQRWPAYCEASAKMRQSMRERIAFERVLLVPLLRREAPLQRNAA